MRKSNIYGVYINNDTSISNEEFIIDLRDAFDNLTRINNALIANEDWDLGLEGIWDSITKFVKKYWSKFTDTLKELWDKLFKKKEELDKIKAQTDEILGKATAKGPKTNVNSNAPKEASTAAASPKAQQAAAKVEQAQQEVKMTADEIKDVLAKSRGIDTKGMSEKELKELRDKLDKEFADKAKEMLQGEHTGILQW